MVIEEVKKLIDGCREKVVGLKQTMRLIENRKIKAVILASDSDPYYTNKILTACKNYGVEIFYIETSKQLASIVGVSVPTSVVGLCD